MSAAIGPGSPLIFKGPDVQVWGQTSGLTIGALYFCKAVDNANSTWPCALCGVVCESIVSLRGHPGRFNWYAACAFSPLGGESTEADAKVREPEFA